MKEISPSSSINVGKGVLQDVLPGYEEEVAKLLTERKRSELSEFFTNPGGRVSAIIPAPRDMTAAVLTARFSRAQEPDSSELYWKEFRHKLGEKVADRILNEYGDDSVREEASGYLMVKGVSVLTSMQAFRHPLITGIEASTRYIDWSKLPEEEFAVIPEKLMSDEFAKGIYLDSIKAVRDAYQLLWPDVWNHVAKTNPRLESQSEAAYTTAVKGAVCDALRGLLPLGIKTSFGVHALYRPLSEMVMNLRASNFKETSEVADEMAVELKKVNPVFIGVVDNEHGQKWTEYQKNLNKTLTDFGEENSKEGKANNFDLKVKVKVMNRDWKRDLLQAARASKKVGLEPEGEIDQGEYWSKYGNIKELLGKINEIRTNRRDKLPSFLNAVQVRVRIENLSFGSFKDLNRHRMLHDKSDPDFSGKRTFVVPKVIEEIGGKVESLYILIQKRLLLAKQILERDFPEESKLLLTHGAKTAVEMTMGLGEVFWISELRSIPSNHPENRKIAIGLYEGTIKKMAPLSVLGKFVDRKDYSLGRIGEAVRADLKGK